MAFKQCNRTLRAGRCLCWLLGNRAPAVLCCAALFARCMLCAQVGLHLVSRQAVDVLSMLATCSASQHPHVPPSSLRRARCCGATCRGGW